MKSVVPVLIEVQRQIDAGNQFFFECPRFVTDVLYDLGVLFHPL